MEDINQCKQKVKDVKKHDNIMIMYSEKLDNEMEYYEKEDIGDASAGGGNVS